MSEVETKADARARDAGVFGDADLVWQTAYFQMFPFYK
jgi:hypothetical protein